MEKKYTLNEGLESLEKIKLMMGYDLDKTLDENKKDILKEDINNFPWCVRFGGVAWPSDPKNSKSKEYTSAVANGSGGFDSTNATYQTFNTPYILNKETHRFFADGTYWKKSPDGKKWVAGTYKCSNQSQSLGPGTTGTILLDGQEDTFGNKPFVLSQISNKSQKSSDMSKRNAERQKIYNKEMERFSQIRTDHPEDLKPMKDALYRAMGFESKFKFIKDMWDCPKPKPPQLAQQYLHQAGTGLVGELYWVYYRCEQGEDGTLTPYYFTDRKGGNEYEEHYKQYKNDLTQWTNDNFYAVHFFKDNHFRNQVLSMATIVLPFGLLLSGAFQLVDAMQYYEEGDNYSAGLAVIFAVLPGVGLTKKSIQRIGKFLKFGKASNIILTAEEQEALRLASQSTETVTQKLLKTTLGKSIKTILSKIGVLDTIKFFGYLNKQYPTLSGIIGAGLQVGGVMYTYTKLYQKYQEYSQKKDVVKLLEIKKVIEAKKTEVSQKLEQRELSTFTEENLSKMVDLKKILDSVENARIVPKDKVTSADTTSSLSIDFSELDAIDSINSIDTKHNK